MLTAADIVIEIPGNLGQEDSSYRLDYSPPYGNPLPNTTIASRDVGGEIQFSNVLPGTKYNFWLYYTNATHDNLLAWTVSIMTGEYSHSSLIRTKLDFEFVSIENNLLLVGHLVEYITKISSIRISH